jgi:hypothetical protein
MFSNEGKGCTVGISLRGAGAITVRDTDGHLWVWDLPAEPHIVALLLRSVRQAKVAIVDAGAALKTRGVIEGMLAAYRMPLKFTRRKSPQDSRSIAARRWPAQAELFSQAQHVARAEAALLVGGNGD